MAAPVSTHEIWRFGVYEVDTRRVELRRNGTPVKLREQSFLILVYLLEHAGEIVTREELRRLLWTSDTFVDFDHSLNMAVMQLRDALGDATDAPHFIETIPKRGYRFIAPLARVEHQFVYPLEFLEATSGHLASTEAAQIGKGQEIVGVVSSAEATAAATDGPQQKGSKAENKKLWKIVVPAAILLLLVLNAVGFFYRWRRARVLTNKDTIVLADFDNKTGDSVFDDTLKQGLSVQLEQSPFLDLLSERRVNETLKLMGRPAGERLTPEVTHEICERTGSTTMLTGSIAGLGSQYVIGLKAVNCNSGNVLAEAQEQAVGKEAVLKALDAAAISLRSKLGESLSSMEKYATPLQEATTPSLEALKVYSLGVKTWYAQGPTAALPFFQRAVELDPSFAMAYAWTWDAYLNLNELGRATENIRKAYDLREKVSERERFGIEAAYYDVATGELEEGAKTDELWQQTFPRDANPHVNLGFVSASLGNWGKALEEWREALRLNPNNGQIYYLLSLAYMSFNRLDEAEAVYEQADERELENQLELQGRYWLAFLKGDAPHMTRLVSAAMGKPGSEDLLLAMQADTEGWYGKLKNARELTGRAMDSAQRNDAKETAAGYQAAAALRDVESGNREEARGEAYAALKLAPNRDVRAVATLALARAGDTAGGGEVGGRTRQDLPAGHACPEVLAAHDPSVCRPGTQRSEPSNRTIEGSKHNRTRRFYGRPHYIPVPGLFAWGSVSHAPRRQPSSSGIPEVH